MHILYALYQLHVRCSLTSAADNSIYDALVEAGLSEAGMLDSGLVSSADIEEGKKAAQIEGWWVWLAPMKIN